MRILVCRTLLIYLSVLVAMRLMGKRQLGELQPAELVSTILISNLASISIESADVPITASLVPLFLITAIEILDSILSLKYPRYAHLVSGRPKAVIHDGEIDQAVLKELRLSVADLMEALRAKDIFDVRDVAYAIVETNGSISAAKRAARETVTLEDLAMPAEAQKATVPFVLDGQLLEENLHYCGQSERWLRQKATDRGFAISEVLLALGNGNEDILWVKKGSRPNPSGSSPM
ncbi:MAG: DUF421 domain-containing protein [Faecalibacterium sp.]|nr:DUF421 domain-containing protein [Faecalibacterium sp.]